jgi:hypothetical protein
MRENFDLINIGNVIANQMSCEGSLPPQVGLN